MRDLTLEFITEGPGSVLRDSIVKDADGNVVGRLATRGFSLMAGAHEPLVYSVEVPARNVRIVNER